jgi:tRNA-dihydrouridine synthase B
VKVAVKIAIGNVVLDNPVVLAPMAGVTDKVYRRLCREMGAGLVCGEMVSAEGFAHNSQRTRELMCTSEREHPVSMQVFGCIGSSVAAAVRAAGEYGADIVDINAGCPTQKIVRTGSGAALMRDLDLFESVVGVAVRGTDKPVTVKLRSGWDADSINVVEAARRAEQCGVAAVAVHPRTRSQMFRGEADWTLISAVVDAVETPVMGSGDVRTPHDARRMMDETGCACVMLGRAAMGNPWIFKQTAEYLLTGEAPTSPDFDEVEKMFMVHLESAVELYGEERACRMMRKHAAWYVRGMPGATGFRREVYMATRPDDYCGAFDNLRRRTDTRCSSEKSVFAN